MLDAEGLKEYAEADRWVERMWMRVGERMARSGLHVPYSLYIVTPTIVLTDECKKYGLGSLL